MNQPTEISYSPALNLEVLEADPAPTFVIKLSSRALPFEFLFCNQAFRNAKNTLQEKILAQNLDALRFRSWAQALGDPDPNYDFANRRWLAERSGKKGTWKIVRAVTTNSTENSCQNYEESGRLEEEGRVLDRKTSEELEVLDSDSKLSFRKIPRMNLTLRFESFHKMLEMSEVGVFEFSSEGKLLHANDAYFRISSWPKDLPPDADFLFMDLVHPEDQDFAIAKWNELCEGRPSYFEMRFKPRPGSNDSTQWTISAAVPVIDDTTGKLISIAGNIIDINDQKKAQEAIQERVDALEQARQSELKFARFAELSPTAIFIFIPSTGMSYVNDKFFEITGHEHAPAVQIQWFDLVAEEDLENVKKDWDGMLAGKKSDGIQFRLKKTWLNQDELDDGKVISIMGALFDISHFKWAEKVQRRRVEEAFEAKRQQENFIDMTSHELRNPLSAMLQCADLAITFLKRLAVEKSAISSKDVDAISIHSEVSACIESLQTIVSCAFYQKRIIDDVLTLSKIDSNLITITPVRAQPSVAVSDAMKMFEIECRQADINLTFREDESFRGMEWAMLDPSRLLQILINLLTNAIKFTKGRPHRTITVTLGGAWRRPPKFWHEINFTCEDNPGPGITDKLEFGSGRKIYIWVQVKDTGCGMTEKEQKMLFGRFAQATPRTHVKYGGSGLGLFISKALSILQGGGIGAKSERGVGSTIAFFIEARLAQPPAIHPGGTNRLEHEQTTAVEEAMKKVKLNILIVEDNLVNQRVLRKHLQMFGWNVSVAGNGQEALEWLKESVYWRAGVEQEKIPTPTDVETSRGDAKKRKHDLDIIFMDIEMPVMDGLACARLIRDYEQVGLLCPPSPQSRRHTNSPTSILSPNNLSNNIDHQAPRQRLRLPILAVSANARSEQIDHALAAGMDDAISKPFRIPELWPKIVSLVERVREGG